TKPGAWRLIDYTVQKVSTDETAPVRVLTERAPEWRTLNRRLAAR
ncbi:MAG: hypothetical protein H7Y06_11205, partial [Opitutaceae bacterium]|nr:hypothetical protein [Opitutaceae bacterium]